MERALTITIIEKDKQLDEIVMEFVITTAMVDGYEVTHLSSNVRIANENKIVFFGRQYNPQYNGGKWHYSNETTLYIMIYTKNPYEEITGVYSYVLIEYPLRDIERYYDDLCDMDIKTLMAFINL